MDLDAFRALVDDMPMSNALNMADWLLGLTQEQIASWDVGQQNAIFGRLATIIVGSPIGEGILANIKANGDSRQFVARKLGIQKD